MKRAWRQRDRGAQRAALSPEDDGDVAVVEVEVMADIVVVMAVVLVVTVMMMKVIIP